MKKAANKKQGMIATETIVYTFTGIIALMLLMVGINAIMQVFNATKSVNDATKQTNASYEKLNNYQ